MSLGIVLRTVCGCERVLMIPNQGYPYDYRVPYIRKNNFHWYTDDEEVAAPMCSARRFERTGMMGKYGYPVYLEVL